MLARGELALGQLLLARAALLGHGLLVSGGYYRWRVEQLLRARFVTGNVDSRVVCCGEEILGGQCDVFGRPVPAVR
jgi:hypothetical protein